MDLDLRKKTVIVTGGSSNINRANVLTFAREGANTVTADLDEESGHKVINEANALGQNGRAILVRTDVTDWNSVQAMVKTVLREFGRIHVLVNGVGWIVPQLFVDETSDEWEKLINVNLWSVVNCTRAVLDPLIAERYGKIINIGSDAGRTGELRQAVYGACKGGVIALTKALAKELGRYNINVNCVCPGPVIPERAEQAGKLSMIPKGMGQDTLSHEQKQALLSRHVLKRLCTQQDIANLVAFLASDASSYITGQTISVDGGFSIA